MLLLSPIDWKYICWEGGGRIIWLLLFLTVSFCECLKYLNHRIIEWLIFYSIDRMILWFIVLNLPQASVKRRNSRSWHGITQISVPICGNLSNLGLYNGGNRQRMLLIFSCFWMLIFFFCDFSYYSQTHKHLVVIPFFKLGCYWEFSYLHVEFTWIQRQWGESVCSIVTLFIRERTIIWRYNKEITIACPSVSPKVFILQSCKASIFSRKNCREMQRLKAVGWTLQFFSHFSKVALLSQTFQNQIFLYDGLGRGIHFQI